MRRFREIFRFVLTLVTAVVLAATPSVQAYQLNLTSGSCSPSCCCGCGCNQDKATVDDLAGLGSSCNCKMSAPEPAEEIPFEAQPRPVSNSDNYADLAVSGFEGEINRIISFKIISVEYPSIHGPPLYLLNSTYLI